MNGIAACLSLLTSGAMYTSLLGLSEGAPRNMPIPASPAELGGVAESASGPKYLVSV